MNKEFKALKRLADNHRLSYFQNDFSIRKDYELVEKALKRLEQFEEDFMTLTETNFEMVKNCQALEIIKREPSAVIEIITTYDTWEEYTNDYPLRDKTIWHIIKNKSEFDLLKEVFDE